MQQLIDLIQFSEAIPLSDSISTLICHHFGISTLDQVHLVQKGESNLLFQKGTDQACAIHELVYKEFDRGLQSNVISSYRKLVAEWLNSLIESTHIQDWAIQRYPSLRVQFPNNVSVFEFHRDSDYNHPLGELNHFLAITSCINTAALHVENNLGWADFIPINLTKGQSAILNTSIFKHGDVINREGFTRVSIDFRAIPTQVLESSISTTSITTKRKFTVNDYFIKSNRLFCDD